MASSDSDSDSEEDWFTVKNFGKFLKSDMRLPQEVVDPFKDEIRILSDFISQDVARHIVIPYVGGHMECYFTWDQFLFESLHDLKTNSNCREAMKKLVPKDPYLKNKGLTGDIHIPVWHYFFDSKLVAISYGRIGVDGWQHWQYVKTKTQPQCLKDTVILNHIYGDDLDYTTMWDRFRMATIGNYMRICITLQGEDQKDEVQIPECYPIELDFSGQLLNGTKSSCQFQRIEPDSEIVDIIFNQREPDECNYCSLGMLGDYWECYDIPEIASKIYDELVNVVVHSPPVSEDLHVIFRLVTAPDYGTYRFDRLDCKMVKDEEWPIHIPDLEGPTSSASNLADFLKEI